MKKEYLYGIEVKDLTIGYTKPYRKVLHEKLNFVIPTGQLISIIGGNGIGKTTLLRTLSKLEKPLNGKVFIQDSSLSDHSTLEIARKLSLVLTHPPASKSISVREFIALGRFPHTNWVGKLTSLDKEKINQAIKATDVFELLEYKCYQLSDGQYQRVAIARAIAQDTPIILLDEPTTHLDLYNRASILKLLKNLAQTHHKTILFSTHEIELALQLSDKVLLLHSKEVKLGSPKEIIDSGTLDTLFPKDSIYFDSTEQRFKII